MKRYSPTYDMMEEDPEGEYVRFKDLTPAAPCSGRFMKLNDFCDLLASIGVVDECAIHDSEGYDGGKTLNKACAAFYEIDNRISQNSQAEQP